MKFLITVFSLIVVLHICTPAEALPVIDGRFDPNEGYTTGYTVGFTVRKTGPITERGQLWLHQDPLSRDLSIAFTQPLALVDNTYGKNEIGYRKHHNFGDLLGSDKAQFTIYGADNKPILDFVLDYISKEGSSYRSQGVEGRDGEMLLGEKSAVTAWGTSLDYNFNTLGFVLTDKSPATDGNYTPNPDYPGWLFEVTYEMRIAGAVFDDTGFGGVSIPIVHDSPNKKGKNQIYPTDMILIYTQPAGSVDPGNTVIVPEPASVVLLGVAVAALWLCRKKPIC